MATILCNIFILFLLSDFEVSNKIHVQGYNNKLLVNIW